MSTEPMTAQEAAAIEPVEPAKAVSEGSAFLFRSAYSLMLNTALTAALGVAYWIVAAHLFSREVVGRDSALISAMIALSAIGCLNMHNVVLRFLPTRRNRPARGLLAAYGVGCASSAVLAVAFVVIVPRLSEEVDVFTKQPALAVLYVVGTTAWTVFAMQDAALTAVRGAPWVPIENSSYGVLKLAALPLLAGLAVDDGVFLAWVIPMMIVVVPVNWLIFRRLLPAHAHEPVVHARAPERPTLRFAAQDAVGFALNMAALTMLPLLVAALVGTRANATFYMPFTIILTFDLLFMSVGSSFVAEGARAEMPVHDLARVLVRRFLPLLALGVLMLVIAAPLILAVFGPSYASGGTEILRIMAVASLFRAAIALFVATSRLRRSGRGTLLPQASSALLLVVLAVVLAQSHGARGVALAWFIASAVVGIAVLPALRRMLGDSPAG